MEMDWKLVGSYFTVKSTDCFLEVQFLLNVYGVTLLLYNVPRCNRFVFESTAL